MKLTSSGDDRVIDGGQRSAALPCSLFLLRFFGGLKGCNALRQRPCGSCGFHVGCGDLMVSAKSPSAASVISPPQTFTRTILTSNLVSHAKITCSFHTISSLLEARSIQHFLTTSMQEAINK